MSPRKIKSKGVVLFMMLIFLNIFMSLVLNLFSHLVTLEKSFHGWKAKKQNDDAIAHILNNVMLDLQQNGMRNQGYFEFNNTAIHISLFKEIPDENCLGISRVYKTDIGLNEKEWAEALIFNEGCTQAWRRLSWRKVSK